jgi:hypothetical protein
MLTRPHRCDINATASQVKSLYEQLLWPYRLPKIIVNTLNALLVVFLMRSVRK